MRPRVPLVAVYYPGEPLAGPSEKFIPREEAEKAVKAGRAKWQDHRRKLRMFQHWRCTEEALIRTQRNSPGISARPNASLIESYAGVRGSRNFAARVAVSSWAGEVKSAAELASAQ